MAPALAGASDAQRHGLEPMELTGEQLLAACETDAPETLGGAHNTDELEHPSMMGHLVRSLMPGQDLTRVTIPSWFLESRSLLEKMADTLMHPDLLIQCVRQSAVHAEPQAHAPPPAPAASGKPRRPPIAWWRSPSGTSVDGTTSCR